MPIRQHRTLPFRIYAITDRHAVPEGMTLPQAIARIVCAAPAGRIAVQLRDKDLGADARREIAFQLRAITRQHGALLLVHSDLDLAAACHADGVHFADGDPRLEAAAQANRERGARQRLWLGASCHDAAGLQRACALGADFATLSPVRPSPGKAEAGEELGWAAFSEAVAQHEIPTFALGGMGPDDAHAAADAGAWGIAAIRSLLSASEPARTIGKLLAPFAPVGSGARGGRIGKPLLPLLALLGALLWGCQPGPEPDDDDDTSAAGDDDSAEEPPPVPVDIPLPNGPFALECSESEPDDIEIALDTTTIPEPPWDQATDCGTIPAVTDGLLLHVSGAIQDLVGGSWNGDNDSYRFTTEVAIEPRGVLRWDPLQGDFDARVICQRGDGWQDLFGRHLATAALAESAAAEFSIEAGASCWLVIVGYSGLVGSYDFWLDLSAEP